MNAIPPRLVVISARVPEGERCDGCEHHIISGLRGWFPDDSHWCGDGTLHGTGITSATDGKRLPACRERDGWRVVPPDADATIGRQVYEPKEEP